MRKKQQTVCHCCKKQRKVKHELFEKMKKLLDFMNKMFLLFASCVLNIPIYVFKKIVFVLRICFQLLFLFLRFSLVVYYNEGELLRFVGLCEEDAYDIVQRLEVVSPGCHVSFVKKSFNQDK